MAEHGTKTRYKQDCPGWVPAEMVRTHVRTLMAQGVGFARTAEVAGVSPYTVERMLHTRRGSRRPATRMREDIAVRILAVQATPDLVADRAAIDSAGTRRRLEALGFMGHSRADLAEVLGVRRDYLTKLVRDGRVSAGLARRVARLYDELWDVRPVGYTADRVRQSARIFGWLSPLAWDDEYLDLSDADLEAAVAREAAEMSDDDARRCQRAFYSLGDRSPLIRAGAQEWVRRRAAYAREERREQVAA